MSIETYAITPRHRMVKQGDKYLGSITYRPHLDAGQPWVFKHRTCKHPLHGTKYQTTMDAEKALKSTEQA